MASIQFKGKVKTLHNMDNSVAYEYISVPEFERKHCDMSAFRMSALSDYIEAKGKSLPTRRRVYAIEGYSEDGGIALATLTTKRARFTAVRCNNIRIASCPDAEVWSVINRSGKEVDCFALTNNTIKEISHG